MEYIYDVCQVKFTWLYLCINMRWTQPMLANISKTCVQRIPAILYKNSFSVFIYAIEYLHGCPTHSWNIEYVHTVRIFVLQYVTLAYTV
jgi:hypothetical protein